MMFDEEVLYLRDPEFLSKHAQDRRLGPVDQVVVAPRLIENASVDAQLIIAFEEVALFDHPTDSLGLSLYSVAKLVRWDRECRRIEQQRDRREGRRLPIHQKVVEESVTSENALDRREELTT
jgi:hypothetical protein